MTVSVCDTVIYSIYIKNNFILYISCVFLFHLTNKNGKRSAVIQFQGLLTFFKATRCVCASLFTP